MLQVCAILSLFHHHLLAFIDPYVRCEQIYQRKRIKLRKTSIKRANLNPVYHECLEFDLALNQIDETNILIQVMDWDR